MAGQFKPPDGCPHCWNGSRARIGVFGPAKHRRVCLMVVVGVLVTLGEYTLQTCFPGAYATTLSSGAHPSKNLRSLEGRWWVDVSSKSAEDRSHPHQGSRELLANAPGATHTPRPTPGLGKHDEKLSNDQVPFEMVAPFYLSLGILSLIGASVITWLYFTTKSLRWEHASTMIQIITVCDLLFTLKFTVSALAFELDEGDARRSFHILDDGCRTAAAYEQFFAMAVIGWNSCWMFDFVCVLRNPLRNTQAFRRVYHVIVWTLCVTTTVAAIFLDVHKDSSDYICWIRADTDNLGTFDVFLYLSLVLAIGSLVYAFVRLNRGTEATVELRKAMRTRHSAYVVSYVLLWLWPATHYIWDQEDRNKGITIVDAIATSGQAAVFAMVRLSEPGAWLLFLRKTGLVRFHFLVPRITEPDTGGGILPRHSSASMRSERSVSADTGAVFNEYGRNESFYNDYHSLGVPYWDEKDSVPGSPKLSPRSLAKATSDMQNSISMKNVSSLSIKNPESRTAENDLNVSLLEHDSLPATNGVYNSMATTSAAEAMDQTIPETPESEPNQEGHEEDSWIESSDGKWKAMSVVSKRLIGSTGQAWDMGSGLRLESGMCMLSGLCQVFLTFGFSKKRNSVSGDGDRTTSSEAITAYSDSESDAEADDGNIERLGYSLEPYSSAEAPSISYSSRTDQGSESGGSSKGKKGRLSALIKRPTCIKKKCKLLINFQKNTANPGEHSGDVSPSTVSSVGSTYSLRHTKPSSHENLYREVLRAQRMQDGGTLSVGDFSSEARDDQSHTRARSSSHTGRYATASTEVSDGSSKTTTETFHIRSFEDDSFSYLRSLAGIGEDEVIKELDPVRLQKGQIRAHFSEGASSAFFCRSYNQRFMVKTITSHEVETLCSFLPNYIAHLKRFPDSLLCRFYGCFELTNGNMKNYFILMGNAFPCIRFSNKWETYDLKGSSVGRMKRVSESIEVSSQTPRLYRRVLYQDEDFKQIHPEGFLLPPRELAHPHSGETTSPFGNVLQQLREDVKLLQQFGLMDYSLLVNIMPVEERPTAPDDGKILDQKTLPVTVKKITSLSTTVANHIQKLVNRNNKNSTEERNGRAKPRPRKRGSNTNATVHTNMDLIRHFNTNGSGKPRRASPLAPSHRLNGGCQSPSHTLESDTPKSITQWSSYSVIPALLRRNVTTASKIKAEVAAEKNESVHQDSDTEQSPDVQIEEQRALVQIGLIDILQPYDLFKRLEKGMKILRHASWTIDVSSQDPTKYADRFVSMATTMFNDPNSVEETEEEEED
eukprot:gb/GECG01013362.1/.p1 GENE.gb/GECG01013362.1/~~gb/GECG01013362.1/.p1  ORF type:complete len:1282 (+),score=146.46 gb/GECG01013362.1/:1-3846(+)